MKIIKDRGITLIALVIIIIVLLILAGVAISTITGENGLLERARTAKETTDNVTSEENNKISQYENVINNYQTRAGADTYGLDYKNAKELQKDPSTGTYKIEDDGFLICYFSSSSSTLEMHFYVDDVYLTYGAAITEYQTINYHIPVSKGNIFKYTATKSLTNERVLFVPVKK